ncbi:hypothetical protein AB1Y20_008472 [Prymnesium parvum]|uniref:Uncharacterized protein n=1 Tax=Prymnesium parvum TaxID=97485 RepID=A0AB34IT85_PRYPA
MIPRLSSLLLSQSTSIARQDASQIIGVLRTRDAFVDRSTIRVAYMLKDDAGNVLVNSPATVVLELQGSNIEHVQCESLWELQLSYAPFYYVGNCVMQALPEGWFPDFGSSSANAVLRFYNTPPESTSSLEGIVATAQLGSVTLYSRPSWWDAGLRSSTVGNGLSAPSGASASSGGVFLTLPASPVHAGESFDVYMYAHTGTFALDTWRVRLYFSSLYVQYSSYAQNVQFNAATISAPPHTTSASWLATGRGQACTPFELTNVTGTAIFLLRITMSVLSSVNPGTHDIAVYPVATELIAGAPFVLDSQGYVFDARGSAQTSGQLTVVKSSTVGLFAYSSAGVLANLAPLTGTTSSYPLTVIGVDNDDRNVYGSMDVSNSASCSVDASLTSVLSLVGCTVQVGAAHTDASLSASVTADYGDGVFGTATFSVYRPQVVTITLDDSTLNRFADMGGAPIPSGCASDNRHGYPYQRTKATAHADGLDATPLVKFAVADESIANVSDAKVDMIEGKRPGSTTVYLVGVSGASPSQDLTVTDNAVSLSALVARVITSIVWSDGEQPSSEVAFDSVVNAGVFVSNVMKAEGDSGFMFTRVKWSDGHEHDIGYVSVPGVDEVQLSVGSPGVTTTAPSTDTGFWEVSVAVGAIKECVSSAVATWSVCGSDVASGELPLYLDLPNPVNISVVIEESRLTSPSDDARLPPISLPTSSLLRLRVTFDDGSERDLSSDSRATYSTPDPTCGSVSSNELSIESGSMCGLVIVVVELTLGSRVFVANHTAAVEYVSKLEMTFSGYPDTSTNRQIALTALGRVPCLSSTYFHAYANVVAVLTDGSTIDVSGQSSFASRNPSVIFISSNPGEMRRLQAVGAGLATIDASFGSSSSVDAALSVVGSVTDSVSSIVWSLPPLASNNYVRNAQASTQLTLVYASGLEHAQLASSAYTSWIDIGALTKFTSAQPEAMNISLDGTVMLLDNYYEAFALTAEIACAPSTFTSKQVQANLKAEPLDVDFGSLNGLQFVHAAGTNYLDVQVHVGPASETTLMAFGIKLGPFDPALLNSGPGASFADGNTFSGIATQFDNPSTEVVLSASNTASTVTSQITLGTVRLNVVGSGVALIQGEIKVMVVQDASGLETEIQYVPVSAGEGYVSLTLSRRRLFLAGKNGPAVLPQKLRPRLHPPSRRLSECSPCTAQVWGDFNGDCQFLASDVLALSKFVLQRESFENLDVTVDPLLSYTALNGESCDFLRDQANPSLDLMSQAGSDTSDPRYGRPTISGVDTRQMLQATVKKQRFLSSIKATCIPSSTSSNPSEHLRVTVSLMGGDGQDTGAVVADPAFTDVFLELRVDPAPDPFVWTFSKGYLASGKVSADSFSGGTGKGFVVQAAAIRKGEWEVEMQPASGPVTTAAITTATQAIPTASIAIASSSIAIATASQAIASATQAIASTSIPVSSSTISIVTASIAIATAPIAVATPTNTIAAATKTIATASGTIATTSSTIAAATIAISTAAVASTCSATAYFT